MLIVGICLLAALVCAFFALKPTPRNETNLTCAGFGLFVGLLLVLARGRSRSWSRRGDCLRSAGGRVVWPLMLVVFRF